MKNKLLLFLATVFLLFNSCKKIREKVFSTRMEGKVIDLQTGKGIPNAKLVVYKNQSYQGGSGYIEYVALKTFYADKDGNFKDKIKITTTENDETYASFMLKAEPEGYEKTNGADYPISGTGIKPIAYLNLTKANKNLELKCNPEYELEISLIDEIPYFIGTLKNLVSWKTNSPTRSCCNIVYPPKSGNDNNAAETFYQNDTLVKFLLPAMEFDLILYGLNFNVNPGTKIRLDSLRISHFTHKKITIKY